MYSLMPSYKVRRRCFHGEMRKKISIDEVLLMSTHNIRFCGEIRKISVGEALLINTHNISFHGEIRKILTLFG